MDLTKCIVFELLFILWLFFSPSVVSAQVVMNELSSWSSNDDWVEIYAFEDTDISGWILRDSAKSPIASVPAGTVVGPTHNKYFVFDAKNRLNKEVDNIKLLKSDDATLVDNVTYGAGSVCAPGQNESIGRYPDANSVWERFTSSTRGSQNSSSLKPCPTPIIVQTATPIPTTPLPTFTPTIKPTIVPTKETISYLNADNREETYQTDEQPVTSVLAVNNESGESDNVTPSIFGVNKENPINSNKGVPLVFVVLGLIFLSGSLYSFIRGRGK